MPVRVRHRVHPQVMAQITRSSGMHNEMLKRAIRIQTAARDRLGHDPKRIDTGRLRSSISIAVRMRETGWAAVTYTDVEYAIYVHEGTRFMQANPFLRDAVHSTRGGASA